METEETNIFIETAKEVTESEPSVQEIDVDTSDSISQGKSIESENVTDKCNELESTKICENIQCSTNFEKSHFSNDAKNDGSSQSNVQQSPGRSSRNSSPEERQNCIYHIKWMSRNNQKTPIITQNENGPCPLIAIINVLILKGRVKLPLTVDIVTSEKLMQHLSDCILDSVPKNIPEGTQLNYEQNVHDAMMVLPKLQTGLDVNVRFTGISDFEYTPECVIFDLLGIPLYHGWLVDPQMVDVVHAIGRCSYNQLVEKIINYSSSQNADEVAESMVAESFLDKTASQLTYHGLCELTSSLRESELCVLFRNNHFISLIKHNNLLYQLVTDQGFLNENVVWESLNNIEGDSQFFDSSFLLVPPKPIPQSVIPSDIPPDNQIDQDYLVALSLQEEQQQQETVDLEWEEYKKKSLGAANTLPDEELARRLQEEEDNFNQRQLQPTTSPSNSSVPNAANRNNNKSREAYIYRPDEDGRTFKWQLVKRSKKKKKKKKNS